MKCEWTKYLLEDITELVIDHRGKTPKKLGGDWSNVGYRALSAKNIKTGRIVQMDTIRFVCEEMYKKWMKDEIQRGDILITSEAPFGQILFWNSDEKIVLSQRLFGLRIKKEFDPKFIYYYMMTANFQGEMAGRATGTTVIGLRQPELMKCEVYCPKLGTQQKIAAILSSLDDKIELNNKINANLEQQAQALFKAWFVDFEPFGGKMPEDWRIDSAECFYNIGIGKTPPRVEAQWFTKNRNGIVWVSIADMGKSGLFIGDSDEYLTEEAVERFNVKVIPEDTVILSFKLTVGRVCITAEKVTTNEAIAHFGMGPENSLEYLYCYLKNFDYGTLGNTSSIALAVNSKTIKKMPIVMPDRKTLMEFHLIVGSLFNRIKLNISENASLATLRDALLPRLMSGQIEL